MLNTIKRLAIGGLISTLSACAVSTPAPGEPTWSALSEPAFEAVSDLIDSTIEEQGVAGYSVALLGDGKLVFKTLGGFANIEHGIPISSDSRYQIYSASKLFFNVALMQQIERGALDPDAPLGQYLSDLPADWTTLTVRQAWSHTTGTTDILDLAGMEPTAEAALASVINIPLKFEPGTKTEYNQTNFLLLKNVFEAVSGRGYQAYLEEELLNPVGITALPFGDLSLVAPNLTTNYEAHGFEPNTLGRRSIKFPPYVYTSAGVNITLDEFIMWWQSLLEGQHIRQDTLSEFWEPVYRSDGTVSQRSNGWERRHENGMLRIGHGGGARIHLFHYVPDAAPERSATVIFLNNGGWTYFDHRAFGDALANIILADQ